MRINRALTSQGKKKIYQTISRTKILLINKDNGRPGWNITHWILHKIFLEIMSFNDMYLL